MGTTFRLGRVANIEIGAAPVSHVVLARIRSEA
jgi:hypothetical protein